MRVRVRVRMCAVCRNGPAAYSDLALAGDDGSVAVIYEAGVKSFADYISVSVFPAPV